MGPLEIEGVDQVQIEKIKAEIRSSQPGAAIPFEIDQLANYYALTLGQAKVSFWFSLVFASIGFLVIVGAAFFYSEGAIAGASIKIASGIIIDAVAALFFVQSRRAQDSMYAFFEKLRSDRQYAEARTICDEIATVFFTGLGDCIFYRTMEAVSAIQNNGATLLVYGWSRYTDVFKVAHITRFSVRMTFPKEGPPLALQFGRYNCTDETCKALHLQ